MNILVVAPHPDDDALGMGGSIAQLAAAGEAVRTIYLTAGEKGCPGDDEDLTANRRLQEADNAAVTLGLSGWICWHYPDGQLSQRSDSVVLQLAAYFALQKPDTIYVPHDAEAHTDHKTASMLVRRALERSVYSPTVLMYEVWTPMPVYDAALTIDITPTIGTKLIAIRKHESQVNRIRFDEAALCLARYRGELHNRPHGPYAEVFKGLTI